MGKILEGPVQVARKLENGVLQCGTSEGRLGKEGTECNVRIQRLREGNAGG